MPWSIGDVDSHIKGLSEHQKRVWVAVANAALKRCQETGNDNCDASAIRQANTMAQAAHESADWLADDLEAVQLRLEPVIAEASEHEIAGDFIALKEKALRRDKTAEIKIIQPGWGSSGYYSPDILERDGPKIFRAGTKMYWDHPTATEEGDRPERSLRDLAAELVSDARYVKSGKQGPGLYADAKVFETFAPAVEELAPHIGVSIRGLGKAKEGMAEGRKGPLIEQLVAARSVDFVTEPGAGGQVVQLFESARERITQEVKAVDEKEAQELRESVSALQASIKTLEESLAKEREEKARLSEGLIIREAQAVVAETLNAAPLPDVTRERLAPSLAQNPPVKDGALDKDALKTKVEEAVKSELEYIQKIAGGPIRGMGPSTGDTSTEDVSKSLEASFARFGLSESATKVAAAGRV